VVNWFGVPRDRGRSLEYAILTISLSPNESCRRIHLARQRQLASLGLGGFVLDLTARAADTDDSVKETREALFA
jgi:hypothetical protein